MPIYKWTDLGLLPGDTVGFATAINSKGVVVGQSGSRAFVYDGIIKPLPMGPDDANSQATAINDSGQIVGVAQSADQKRQRVFLYSDGKLSYLSVPAGTAYATGINNSGQVVGWSENLEGGSSPTWVWSPGGDVITVALARQVRQGFFGLGAPFAVIKGAGINDAGQVCGQADFGHAFDHAFMWSPGGPGGTLRDLGVLPGTDFSYGVAINSSGAVAGISATFNSGLNNVPFYWKPVAGNPAGALVNIAPPLGSGFAYGINASGAVVGFSPDLATDGNPAFIWQNGQVTDLETLLTSGVDFVCICGMNDPGQIVGVLDRSHDQFHPLLLSPVSTSTPNFRNWASLISILFGIINDSSGIGVTPGGQGVHVPPRAPVFAELIASLPAATIDALLAIALQAASQGLRSPESQRQLRQTALAILDRAVRQIQADAAGDSGAQ